jgi:hypothetical protein
MAATGSFPTAHQAASPSGVVYAGQETQLNILSMEEDEFSDHESVKVRLCELIHLLLSSFFRDRSTITECSKP